jgi:hypothetical protein
MIGSSLTRTIIERTIMTKSSAETYQIRLGVRLTPDRVSWFDEMLITYADEGETLLTGPLIDQTALHGVLAKIRDMGLPLISVTRLTSTSTSTSAIILPDDSTAT